MSGYADRPVLVRRPSVAVDFGQLGLGPAHSLEDGPDTVVVDSPATVDEADDEGGPDGPEADAQADVGARVSRGGLGRRVSDAGDGGPGAGDSSVEYDDTSSAEDNGGGGGRGRGSLGPAEVDDDDDDDDPPIEDGEAIAVDGTDTSRSSSSASSSDCSRSEGVRARAEHAVEAARPSGSSTAAEAGMEGAAGE